MHPYRACCLLRLFPGRLKNNCSVQCNSREMTACLSTIESCNADLTPVIFKSRIRSLCKRKRGGMEMEGFSDKMARVFSKQLHEISLLLHAPSNQNAQNKCSSLVHGVWNGTVAFSWSLVIAYCPVGHTHFRYHIRHFHAGLTANAQAMREIPSLGNVLKSMACTKYPHPYMNRVNELQLVWSVSKGLVTRGKPARYFLG